MSCWGSLLLTIFILTNVYRWGVPFHARFLKSLALFLKFRCDKWRRVGHVTHYLDDFVFIAPTKGACQEHLSNFTAACGELGVPIAGKKTEGPAQVLSYLGLVIDTVSCQVKVPADKVSKITRQVEGILGKTKATLVQIQSLIGSLNFLCRAVAPGRAFTRRVMALTNGLRHPQHKVRISKGAKLDLLMWLTLLRDDNGVTPFLQQDWESSEALEFFTDAAASIGFGVFVGGRWLQGRWPQIFAFQPSIALLELFPIVVAILCWGPLLSNRKVIFRSDNIAVVHMVNGQSSQCPKAMHLIRLLGLE